MRLLLDTHAFLWWLVGHPMAPDAIEAISGQNTAVFVSAASIWEAEIKAGLGKLTLDVDLVEEAATEGFQPLPISLAHGRRVGRLPTLHRDPFDRMLVAQALEEDLAIVTRDDEILAYEVKVMPC